jgi:hypothetical protein
MYVVVMVMRRCVRKQVDCVADLDSNAIEMRDSRKRKSIVKLNRIATQYRPGTQRYARRIGEICNEHCPPVTL